MITPEQAAAQYQSTLASLFSLSSKSFEGVEKLLTLNVAALKAGLAEAQANAEKMAGARDAQEMVNLQVSLAQPTAEKLLSYSQQVSDIANAARADFAAFAEAQAAEVNRNLAGSVDGFAKSAPTGSEAGVTLMKNALAAANGAYESMSRASKQFTEMAQANLNTTQATARQAASNVTKMKR